ncbi:MAG: baseplate J/gp47 family protein [Fimbriimonas sp.]
MAEQYSCNRPHRLAILLDPANAAINGLDYLEVAQDADGNGATLTLRFARDVGLATLTEDQIRISGGVRFGAPDVVLGSLVHVNGSQVVTLKTKGASDFSSYQFQLVRSSGDNVPPPGFDPELSSVEFSFKAACPSDFDCVSPGFEGAELGSTPAIDYLSKDYESFRRLMLDRLSVTMPQWTERNPADLGVALVEVLAHAADYLSYYQDAVATEAYLGTARRRTSIRRHARMLDYPMHDGCNARAWVHFQVVGNSVHLPTGAPLLIHRSDEAVLPPTAVENPQGPVFETMHDAVLWPELNEIPIHAYFDGGCSLPAGATQATLWDQTGYLSEQEASGRLRRLKPGDTLLFEEICDDAGSKPDADPTKRHVVRLTSVALGGESIRLPGETGLRKLLHVTWHDEDALPFGFELEATTETGRVPRVVARGNLVLADHGQTIRENEPALWLSNGDLRLRYNPVSLRGRSGGGRGHLARDVDNKPLPFDPRSSALSARTWSFANVFPEIRLLEADGDAWLPQRDLLASGPFSKEFVLETDENGRSSLRFGDGTRGMRPTLDLTPVYRIGNGAEGNVGAESIAHIALNSKFIRQVRNPLPSFGGTDPEATRSVKLFAPYAFQRLERAVTDADYAELALRHPEVQRAVAYRRWTGSWYSVVLLVDRKGGKPITDAFSDDLIAFFEMSRLAGYDLEIKAPISVPPDIAMTICVEPNAFRAHVKAALLREFANTPGAFFDPDRLTFGVPIYVSEIVARAMSVQGVSWVDLDPTSPSTNRFQRFGQVPAGEYAAGKIDIKPREIARLDNDRSRPEDGRLEFFMRGGR